MSNSNTTDVTNPSTFILLGIAGLEAAHGWISIPFCLMYIVAILGNSAILFIVKSEPRLHEPMYYFLCMLAVSDLVLSTSIVPKTLSIFWFNSREIDFASCFTQMYLVHCFLVIESGMFTAMAFDRYVAICDPLRHSTILTNSIVAKIGLSVVLRGFMLILPIPIMGSRWPYCKTNIVPHTYCKHFSVVSLACADIRPSNYYSVCVTFFVPSVDGFLIALSYIQILRAIFRLPTKDARLKAFGTCGTHLCALSTLYIPDLSVSLMQRIDSNVSLPVLILMANVKLLVPPLLHPIIYGMRTKQIRDRLLWIVTQKSA
ncbi:olfactory receptor 52M1-like [Pelodiscus sinensis]|uniref:olfactory receptor 52M1-like n=1 Tax=Pelodiscus sinensis TaxID=13735 RepID=UPI003F6C8639